jgi:hypothetical protein
MYQRAGDAAGAARWQAEGDRMREGLQTIYDPAGFFYACSRGPNRKPSVNGSAFAVYVGATSPAQNRAIGEWLSRNYDACIQAGQVRHLVRPDIWQVNYPANVYQNGGYWATPFAWANRAIRNVDPALADRMLRDILTDSHTHGIHEVVNYDIDYVNRAGHAGEYCASLAPLITLRELGVPMDPAYRNVALASHGTRVETSSVHREGADPKHQPGHLIDGRFGNDHSWIPNASDPDPWVRLALPTSAQIDMIVIGRDNWAAGILDNHHAVPNRTGYSDRNVEAIEIRVSTDGATWSEPVYANRQLPPLKAGENHVIKLGQPVSCRYLQVKLQPNTACIDEYEVFGRM